MGQLENSDTDEFSIVKPDESFSPNGTMWQDRVEKMPYIYIIFRICANSKTKRSRGFAFPVLRILMWIN